MTREDFIKLINKGVITQVGFVDSKGNIKYDGDLDDLANKLITKTGITDGTSEGKKTQEWIDKFAPTDADGDGQPDPKKMPALSMVGLEDMLPYDAASTATLNIIANDYAGANVTLTWDADNAAVKVANKNSWSVKSLSDKDLAVKVTPEANADAYSVTFRMVDDLGTELANTTFGFEVKPKPVDVASLKAAIALGGDVKLEGDIDLSEQVVISNDVVLDLNGKSLTNSADIWNDKTGAWSLLSVQGGNLTINGDGSLLAKADDCYVLDVRDGGNLTINGGSYNGNITAAYAYEGALEVNGGSFDIQQLDPRKGKAFLLNCLDKAYTDGTASIVVKGGSYNGWNPAANAAETIDETTNFVAEGYNVEENAGVYTVVKA